MSDTPRTDENVVVYPREDSGKEYVWADFARKLEDENAALRASHGEIYAALGTSESDHTKWPQQIAALRKQRQEMNEINEAEAAIAADTIKVLKAENAALRTAGNVLCIALEAELQAYVRVLEMFEDDDLSHAKKLEATINQWKNEPKP
jgi:uncharacterized protein (UPF0335 family)